VSEDLNPRIAERLARAARAAQSLSETLWEALHEELLEPRARRVAELSERLGEVSAAVALLVRGEAPASSEPEPPVTSAQPEGPAARALADAPAPTTPVPITPAPTTPAPSAAVAHEDERARGGVSSLDRESTAAQGPRSAAVLVDELAPEVGSAIEIRDERGEHPPSPWIGAIEGRLERYERDRAPFAVLLLELADVERLRHSEPPGEIARLTRLVESVLTDELRPADSLARESPGRYWLLAPEADPASARALAERLAEAVRGAASHRGAPLRLAVGVALCPDDGSRAGALAARADVALYAARAAGRPVAP
jgi:GGDEF domain-containing protein